jgi:hypothetical protein
LCGHELYFKLGCLCAGWDFEVCVKFFGVMLIGENEGMKADFGANSAVAAWTAVVSIMDWRYHKANGMHRGAVAEAKNEFDHVELGEAAPYQK